MESDWVVQPNLHLNLLVDENRVTIGNFHFIIIFKKSFVFRDDNKNKVCKTAYHKIKTKRKKRNLGLF